jgi:hypothetical protein
MGPPSPPVAVFSGRDAGLSGRPERFGECIGLQRKACGADQYDGRKIHQIIRGGEEVVKERGDDLAAAHVLTRDSEDLVGVRAALRDPIGVDPQLTCFMMSLPTGTVMLSTAATKDTPPEARSFI